MATRYTLNSLKADVIEVNKTLAESGSVYFFKVWPRNGHNALDLYKSINGVVKCVRNIDCGEPPRALNERMLAELEFYLGKAD